jgi:hypothetical protein
MSNTVLQRAFVVIMAGTAIAWSVPTYNDVKEQFATTKGGNFRDNMEPNGFSGMAWGEQSSKNKLLQLKRNTGPESVYVKRNEVSIFFGGAVRNIEYYFANGLFHKVLIELKTRDDFEKVLQTMQSMYGADYKAKKCGFVSRGYKRHYGTGKYNDNGDEIVRAYDFEEAYNWKGNATEVLIFSKCDDSRDNFKIVNESAFDTFFYSSADRTNDAEKPRSYPAMTYCVEFSATSVTTIDKTETGTDKTQETGTSDFKPGTEPIGFRATKWGMTPLQIGKPCKIDVGFALPFSTYTNANDYLTVGSTELKSICYVFQADKLVGIVAEINGSTGYDYIFDLCTKKFGNKVIAEDAPVAMVAWNGAVTHVKMAHLANEHERYYIVYVCARVAPTLLEQWKYSMRPVDEKKALEYDL